MRGPLSESEHVAYDHLVFALHEIDKLLARRRWWRRFDFHLVFSGTVFGFAPAIVFAIAVVQHSYSITSLALNSFLFVIGLVFWYRAIKDARNFHGLPRAKRWFRESDLTPSDCLMHLKCMVEAVTTNVNYPGSVIRYLDGLHIAYAVKLVQATRLKDTMSVEIPPHEYLLPDDLGPLYLKPMWMDVPSIVAGTSRGRNCAE